VRRQRSDKRYQLGEHLFLTMYDRCYVRIKDHEDSGCGVTEIRRMQATYLKKIRKSLKQDAR
jgi:hypothetical protein